MAAMTASAAKALVLLWAAGVMWEYKGLAYPHKAWLFHLHTTFAAVFVVVLVFATSYSIDASSTKATPRQQLLKSHKWGMLLVSALSSATAGLMLYKKWAGGLGLLLLSGRMPSYHSWTALSWAALEMAMVVSGLAIYIDRQNTSPPAWLKAPLKALYGSVGAARAKLKPSHKTLGFVACTLGMGAAALGLWEKNEKPFRHGLAALLVLVWALLWLPHLGGGSRDAQLSPQ